ncbi:MAG: hypothetical protein J6J42_05455 [Lachnospiraceae bacterium]|nr:hypothetical protein [Lachnospiraceae bacterium]MBP3609766.1 hypothetical protein [Lachnospiraceae bacterium]
MKKFTALLMTLVMCVFLAACGTDKQPAIDAFNATSSSFDQVVNAINADPGAYPEELISVMVDMSGLLTEYKELLQGDTEVTEEDLDAMIAWFAEVDGWVAEVKTEFGIQ